MSDNIETFPEKSMDDRIAVAVLKRDVQHLDKALSEVKTDMKNGFIDLHKKIDNNFSVSLSALGGGVALILGFIYFFFGNR